MNLTIRGAEPADLDAVHRIFSCANVIRGSLRMPHCGRAAHAQRLQPDPAWHRLVAVVDHEVQGFAELEACSNPRLRHAAHLNMMAVSDELQGQGIGTALLCACLDIADNFLLARRVQLEVWAESAAVRLYRAHGFIEEGRHVEFGVRDGRYQDMLTMARLRQQLH
jgi:putative acetyltransferase